jgi:hypothetical protein
MAYVQISRTDSNLELKRISKEEADNLSRACDNRKLMANELRKTSEYCAEIVENSYKARTNLINTLKDKQVLEKVRELYKNDKNLYSELGELLKKEKITAENLKTVFKDYEAHHIIPVNVMARSEDLVELLENSRSFKFNGLDNLIFIHKKSHKGSHPEYDDLVEDFVVSNSEDLEFLYLNLSEFRDKLVKNIIDKDYSIPINSLKL